MLSSQLLYITAPLRCILGPLGKGKASGTLHCGAVTFDLTAEIGESPVGWLVVCGVDTLGSG